MSAKSIYKSVLKNSLITAFNSSKEGSANTFDDGVIDSICEAFANALETYARSQVLIPTGLLAGTTPVTGATAPGNISAP